MDLREKAFAGLQLQHPTGHLSIHKLCLKLVGKEGEAQEGSSWLQLLRSGVAGHAEQKLSQQERTTTIRNRCSVYQAVGGEKWQLASSARRCQPHRRIQTYVAGILKVGVVDCPLEDELSNECRWAVEVRPRATEKRKKGVL